VGIDDFLKRWGGREGGAERANYALFLGELATVLDVPPPDPGAQGRLGDYQFEGYVRDPQMGDKGFIDLYKRGCFILEAKQSRIAGDKRPDLFDPAPSAPAAPSGAKYDRLMQGALAQAKGYAVALPADHPWPSFLIVCDVGRAFELYFDFSGNGRGYDFFPNAREYRIPLEALAELEMRDRLRAVWTEPRSLDPRAKAAEVTRAVAARLAEVSKFIEESNRWGGGALSQREREQRLEDTALFVMRLLFCMFAQNVGLLPAGAFTRFLGECLPDIAHDPTKGVDERRLEHGLAELWRAMGKPPPAERYSLAVGADVKYFNGGLFSDPTFFRLGWAEVRELHAAAGQNWAKVEPAIFGTLLEQALSTTERAKLGAHYTPRPYVERLVRATIMDVLEADWAAVEATIAAHVEAGDDDSALAAAVAFHGKLKAVRVLDPACGTGNFLYVAMELILALEARVRLAIQMLGGHGEQGVIPENFLGLELNPRAAVIADLLVWIGYLRWRAVNVGGEVPEPVLRRTGAINGGKHGGFDALLQRDASGNPLPLPAEWPDADFIVGNPPFIGGKDVRAEHGDAYVDALAKANPDVPGSADFVMQWWDRAATRLIAPGTKLRRFGFVTTNSITQVFSRRVVARHLGELSLVMAVGDHPWIKPGKRLGGGKGKQKEGGPAAVRIAMTVAAPGARDGCLLEVVKEAALDTDTPEIRTEGTLGHINADLTIGADVTGATPLLANEGLACPGVKLHGAGFIVTPADAVALGLGRRPGLEAHIRPYRNGRDLMQGFSGKRAGGMMVIDLFGLGEADVRGRFPEVWQHVLSKVRDSVDEQGKPDGRAVNARATYRNNWWIFGEPRSELRPALKGLPRFIATVETSKHRVFEFLDATILPDNMIVATALEDGFALGVLSSRIHTEWALRAGGWLGVGNDNRYNKSKVFDSFPFPDPTHAIRHTIATIADELDSTRKAALAEHPRLTMTGLYNLVTLIRAGNPLTQAQEADARDARAWIMRELHDTLDRAVAAAYGWPADLTHAQIVTRLVALNAERAAEEREGTCAGSAQTIRSPASPRAPPSPKSDPLAKAEKRLVDMRRNPKGDWRIEDIAAVCRSQGIACDSPSHGSHYQLSHPALADILTIPARRPIKPIYVQRFCAYVDRCQGRDGNEQRRL